MAIRRADGSIKLKDGRILFANSLILAQDFAELVPLFSPPPIWPFVSGGGGGGGSGAGTPGARGSAGAPGAQGPQGTNPGPQGNQGNAGTAGTQGNQGRDGPQGNQGAMGSGAQGFQGPQGAQGFQGPQGAQGSQGNQGTQGAQAPLANDIFASTRVVDLGGAGTDLTLASAIAALPAGGGDIYVKPGVYAIAATLDFTTKVVRLRGAGTSVDFAQGPTTLVPAAGIALFANGGQGSSVEDLTVEGDNASSQIFYQGDADIRFTRIDVHDVAGIINSPGADAEVLFRDSYINVPSGVTIPLADRYVWKAGGANGTLIFDNVELFVTGSGATLMSGANLFGGNGPTFKVVNSYVGGGGGGGSTNFWFAQSVVWTQFELDNAQVEVSGAFNTIVNCDFLDFAIRFKAVWNFISNSKFSQGGVGGGFFDSQIHFTAGFAGIPNESIVTGCLFYANFVSNYGIKIENVFPVAVSNCLFENHTIAGVFLTGGTTPNASQGSVTGCRFTETTPLIEGDANVVGTYASNSGFTGAVIAGATSTVDDRHVRKVTGNTTLVITDETVLVDATAAPVTITLPTAASVPYKCYNIKKIDATANAVTIDANGAETIDGALTQVITVQYVSLSPESDNVNAWWIV